MISTLVKEGKAVKIKEISVKKIINAYSKSFDIDVLKEQKIQKILLFECVASNYKFYYPLNLSGDSSFYEKLQNIDWYYMPWKWEHDFALKYINQSDNILEVGCGNGGFLKELIKRGYSHVYGIELNENAVKWSILRADFLSK